MKRFKPEISSGSMADIAFLLLIFFLVATTIEQDKGLLRKLPNNQESERVDVPKRNVLFVLLNSNNVLMVNDVVVPANELKDIIKQVVLNQGSNKNWPIAPNLAIISLNSDEGANYNTYIQVQNEIAKAYREMRNERSLDKYGKAYEELKDQSKINEIKSELPMKVSEVVE
ncbi:MAG: biopolymer transporter ExbD [Bacteroidia bacterium]